MADRDKHLDRIEEKLHSIELRLNHLESLVGSGFKKETAPGKKATSSLQETQAIIDEPDEGLGLESRIGRVGLAWIGNIVLLLGIIFLTEYLSGQGQRLFSVVLGYLSAAAIFLVSGYLKKSNNQLSFMLDINGQALLFFVTLRLHFLSPDPVIGNLFISTFLLLLIVGYQFYISIRRDSQSLAVIGAIFASVTAAMSDLTHVMLPILVLTAAGSIYLYLRNRWSTLVIISIFLVYIVFTLWLLGNPEMSHPLGLIAEHKLGYLYLFGLGGGYSLLPLFRKDDGSRDEFLIGTIMINGLLFTLLLAIVTLRFFPQDYVLLFGLITFCCLAYSTVLKSTSDWNFASAFYALYGFMAMSISLYGLYGFPRVYLLLSVQSLIVVSMALWFKNRLMVIMNSLLFLTILLVYTLTPGSINGVNISFAAVSLISARVINWQKARLQIKTEIIRNLYLIIGFLTVLNALYHAVPRQFVTLSWTIAAVLYFGLSFILRNVKYRYMALGTMISAAFYLFLVDLARIEVIFRVLAFLSLAVISIGISIYYTSRLKKPGK